MNQAVLQRDIPQLQIVARLPRFRALLADDEGVVVGVRGRALVRMAPPFERAATLGWLPARGARRLGRVRLLERLLRLEVYRMVRTSLGTEIATSREGILRRAANESTAEVVFSDFRSHRPLSLCMDGQGRVYFGEYFDNAARDMVRIFQSDDDGLTWSECYRFPPRAVRHVHGLVYDTDRDKIWVMTGDYGDEAKIALATPGFRQLEVVREGSQQTRACDGICTPEGLVYATDTPLEQNHVYLLNPESGALAAVAQIQNSVLFMGEACGGMFLSTIVEPSQTNTTTAVHIWYSRDGITWQEVLTLPRDRWHVGYFQFPTASFARSPRLCPYVFISLRGTRDDGHCLVARVLEPTAESVSSPLAPR